MLRGDYVKGRLQELEGLQNTWICAKGMGKGLLESSIGGGFWSQVSL